MTVKLSARHAYLHRPPPGGGIFGAALCQAPGGERESDEFLRVSSLYKKQKPYDFCFDYIAANNAAPYQGSSFLGSFVPSD